MPYGDDDPAFHGAASLAAALTIGAGSAVVSWWLIGNLSVHSRPPEDLDYSYRPPTVPHWLVPVLGPVAMAVLAVIAGALVVAASHRQVDGRWLRVAAALAFAGFLFALIGRTESAGTIGANIGGGLAVLFIGPVVAGLTVWAVVDAQRILRGGRGSHLSSDV